MAQKKSGFRLSKDGIVSDFVEYEDCELLWKLDGEAYVIHNIMAERKLTSAKLHKDLRPKLRDGAIIDGVGLCRRVHESDADAVCEYHGVAREVLYTTRGEARARARELPCGSGWKESELRGQRGGCVRLG